MEKKREIGLRHPEPAGEWWRKPKEGEKKEGREALGPLSLAGGKGVGGGIYKSRPLRSGMGTDVAGGFDLCDCARMVLRGVSPYSNQGVWNPIWRLGFSMGVMSCLMILKIV